MADAKREPVDQNGTSVKPQVQHLYANGFELSSSLSDVGIVTMIDGQPMAKVAMSFTTAKTLAIQLQGAIDHFETTTGQSLLSMDDVATAYGKDSE